MSEAPPPALNLHEKQKLFPKLLADLIKYAYGQGYELTLGESYIGDSIDKPTEDTPHLRTGNHFKRLAIDLNLFVGGVWITGDHMAWHDLGAYWMALHPLAAWGGTFRSRDFNHFSMFHEGRA